MTQRKTTIRNLKEGIGRVGITEKLLIQLEEKVKIGQLEASEISDQIEQNLASITEERNIAQAKKEAMDRIFYTLDNKKKAIEYEFNLLNKELSFLDPMMEEAERTLNDI